ncbi:hypothetical protein [Acinetobacter shaoyimingii]|uniref:Lipoprotein n=1 Tax=Acinetobacter shaoyimingii TaxID=2715164 RepID=A0A6G8RZC7_9GAMM|nr:hypothetical protein [Acinetobacter shaoyimingii]NHB59347.1 hypothetical protein [Acinetobacter shaoyimingii]QIO07200.1 hypothetical protein G8E00_15300 [Acinetobacter shaoyimingii]
MKKLIQGALIPFSLFAFVMLIIGCDPSMQTAAEHDQDNDAVTQQEQPKQNNKESDNDEAPSERDLASNQSELKSGNFFYIASDVALMQSKTGRYVSELQKTQEQFQQALDSKNTAQLESTANHLYSQLNGFNQALNGLDLRTQEIDQIRQNLMKANKEALKSPYLNGEIDISQIDVKKVQQQMTSIQSEMLKLAAMILAPEDKNDQQNQS